MARSIEYSLSVIRGFLGFFVAIQLVVVAYLIQTGLQEFIQSAVSIPTTLIPILNALQITVGLALGAAFLLVIGLIVRLMAPDGEGEQNG